MSVLNLFCDHVSSVPIAPGRVAQSVACPAQEPVVHGSIPVGEVGWCDGAW